MKVSYPGLVVSEGLGVDSKLCAAGANSPTSSSDALTDVCAAQVFVCGGVGGLGGWGVEGEM